MMLALNITNLTNNKNIYSQKGLKKQSDVNKCILIY